MAKHVATKSKPSVQKEFEIFLRLFEKLMLKPISKKCTLLGSSASTNLRHCHGRPTAWRELRIEDTETDSAYLIEEGVLRFTDFSNISRRPRCCE